MAFILTAVLDRLKSSIHVDWTSGCHQHTAHTHCVQLGHKCQQEVDVNMCSWIPIFYLKDKHCLQLCFYKTYFQKSTAFCSCKQFCNIIIWFYSTFFFIGILSSAIAKKKKKKHVTISAIFLFAVLSLQWVTLLNTACVCPHRIKSWCRLATAQQCLPGHWPRWWLDNDLTIED